jgi:hypothetical protein
LIFALILSEARLLPAVRARLSAPRFAVRMGMKEVALP